jgi:hypothetical protein
MRAISILILAATLGACAHAPRSPACRGHGNPWADGYYTCSEAKP